MSNTINNLLQLCIEEHTKFQNETHRNAFHVINNRRTLGTMMYIYHTFKPNTLEEFYLAYIQNDKGNDDYRRGRSVVELMTIAKMYQNIANIPNDTLTTEQYYRNIIYHSIVQTWDGVKHEREAMKYIQSLGIQCDIVDDKLDVDYGVDIDTKKYFIQIKPITFLYGHNNQSLNADRNAQWMKNTKCLEEFHKPTLYLYYTNDNAWVFNPYSNGKLTFTMEQSKHLMDDLTQHKITIKSKRIICQP